MDDLIGENAYRNEHRRVQFVKQGFFGPAYDEDGNAYWVRGLVGYCIVRESIRTKTPAGAHVIEKGPKQFEVVGWY